ncbi:olfactory receptor 7A5-like [Sorex araneus]|uniref:olfactory receptor 7A5-like n=1 Tax=Sorex araneus TaxID=42254 RepID=UPI0024336482|nr:olfactory receptor 7A5-like [Sorex araneus]
MHFLIIFAILDNILLTVVAYDHFVAIYHTLHYTVIMNPRSGGYWDMSARTPYCKVSWRCDCPSACLLNGIVPYAANWVLDSGPLTGILYSHTKIVSSLSGMVSLRASRRHFPPASPHDRGPLFYCIGIGMYLSAAACRSSCSSDMASVIYTVVNPC